LAALKDRAAGATVASDEHDAVAPVRPATTTLVAVALVAATGLIWEIVLTRLASVVLSYHFAFVAVSLAVSGLGAGAALVYALPQDRGRRVAAPGAIASALMFTLVALLTPPIATSGTLIALTLLALLPFVALGITLSAVFRMHAASSTLLYGADLIGAGFGAAAAVLGLDVIGPFGTLFALAVMSATAALLLDRASNPMSSSVFTKGRGHGRSIAAALVLCMAAAGLVIQTIGTPLGIDYAALRNVPPDKTIGSLLHDSSRHARVVATRWDAYARTDVVITDDPSRRDVFVDGGAGTYMLRWDGNPLTQGGLRDDLETLPFVLGPHANVLIMGAGGGIDVVRALAAGARHVTAVELNGATVDAVRVAHAYNGNVLDHPGVTTIVDDGRHFLTRTREKYDVILLNLVYSGTAEGTSHALAESYIFTTQAFQTYLAHLTRQGRIGVVSHQGLEGTRTFTTGLEALHRTGLSYKDALMHATLLMTNNDTPEARPTLTIVSQPPLTGHQVRTLRSHGNGDLNLRPIWVPYLYQGALKQMAAGSQTLDQFLQGEDYNVGPTDDDRPFFFDFNPVLPDGLNAAIWFAVVLTALVIATVFFLREGPDEEVARRGGATARLPMGIWILGLYVALLGIGFMCVEVPVIQRFILILGEPVLALTVVLATLLVAGGVGSLIGARLCKHPDLQPVAPLMVAVLVLTALVVYPALQSTLLSLERTGALIGSAVVLVPLGLALGLPFPLGLHLAARVLPGDVALLWCLNALFSVLGSVMAAVIAVQGGFAMVLIVGALCYALAAAVLRLMLWRTKPYTRTMPREYSVSEKQVQDKHEQVPGYAASATGRTRM